MRFAIAALLFVLAIFGFFIGFSVSSLLLGEVGDALAPHAARVGSSTLDAELILIPTAFGIICSIALCLIVLVFFLDSVSDEPEYYYRR